MEKTFVHFDHPTTGQPEFITINAKYIPTPGAKLFVEITGEPTMLFWFGDYPTMDYPTVLPNGDIHYSCKCAKVTAPEPTTPFEHL